MQPEIEIICPVCGNSYKANPARLKFGRQTTCSRKCSYQLRASKMRNGTELVCAVCGRKFYRTPSQIKSKHKSVFCSPVCQYVGRSLGLTPRIVSAKYTMSETGKIAQEQARKRAVLTRKKNGTYRHSEATRRKLAEATAALIVSGKIKRISGIEDIVAQELTRRGVCFIRQYGIRGEHGQFVANADFYIPATNTVLEVNGTFWHADPRVYDPADLKPAQIRTVQRYASKQQILNTSGIRLIELWESEIKQDVFQAVENIMDAFVP